MSKEKCKEVYNMSKREDYVHLLSELKSAQNEEEVITNITKIIKGFTSDYYKNDLYENPYFKSFIPEIKEIITSELSQIKYTLKEEISAINNEIMGLNSKGITSINDPDISKLRQLKKECLILIKELDNRLEDLLLL
jgi:hypothetical protein